MLPGVALTGAQVALTGPARYDRAKQRKLCQGPLILQSVSIFVTGLATAFHSHTFTVSHVTGPGLAPGEPTVDMAPNHVLCFFFYLLHEPGDAQFGPSSGMASAYVRLASTVCSVILRALLAICGSV